MKKNDWIGLGASLAAHAMLLFLMTFLTAATPEMEQLGFVEVEFGPFTEGQRVQQAPVETPDAVQDQPVEEPVEPEVEEVSPPEEAKPVDLPDQPEEIADEDVISSPETETVSPEEQNNPEEVQEDEPDVTSEPIRPLGSGTPDGIAGAESGDEGEGSEEQQTAPFQIEGLDRNALFSPLPTYGEKVNATIRIRITVDPQGRIVQRLPLLKGNPTLEQSVMDALSRWKFNPLPPNAPQEVQTGVVTFHFRLE
jgi:protein TonB